MSEVMKYPLRLLLCSTFMMLLVGCQSTREIQPVAAKPILPINRLQPFFSPSPEYIATSNLRCQAGWVHVSFNVDKMGKVVKPIVVASSPEGLFDRIALQSVQNWRFSRANYQRTRPYHTLVDFPAEDECE